MGRICRPQRTGRFIEAFSVFLVIGCFFVFSDASVAYENPFSFRHAKAREAEKLVQQGDYQGAIAALQVVLADFRKKGKAEEELRVLERMGWLQREIGNYGDALVLLRQAYPIGVRLNGDAAEIDVSLGDVAQFSGDAQEARRYYEKTLNTLSGFVFETQYDAPPSPDEFTAIYRKMKAVIHARTNLGTLNYFEGKNDIALTHLKEADSLIQRVFEVAYHPMYGSFFSLDANIYEGVGFCHTMMGAVYGEIRRFDLARKFLKSGKKAFKAGKRTYGLMVNRALSFKVKFLADGFTDDEETLNVCDRFLEETEQFGARDIVWRMGFIIGEAAMAANSLDTAHRYLVKAVDALEETRTRLREDTVKRMFASSVQDVYAAMIRLSFLQKKYSEGFDYLERAKARAFLDMLAGRSIKAKTSVDPALVKKAARLEASMDQAERKLKFASGAKRKEISESYRKLLADRDAVFRSIKEQSLAYAATTTVTTKPVIDIAAGIADDTALISYFIDGDRVLIWTVFRGTVAAVEKEFDGWDLTDMIADYREAISSRQDPLAAEVGGWLASVLLKPVLNQTRGAEKLLIVPSGVLHYLPFSALPLAKDRFVVDSYTVVMLPNATSLFLINNKITENRDRFLAMGNPERKGDAPPLAFAEKEVNESARHFAQHTVLTGRDALESVLKASDLTGTSVIHLAAHGRFDTDHPMKSALLLASDDNDDGNLETLEVFGLQMNPRLMVLSACQSGLGTVAGGDEVQGLNRAFLYAGSGGVVATLWNVADASTYGLMAAFYKKLKTMAPASALRAAQLEIKNELPSAYHWAAFYLTGGLE